MLLEEVHFCQKDGSSQGQNQALTVLFVTNSLDTVTSLARKRTPLGPCCRPKPRVLGGSYGGGRFLMGEVPLNTAGRGGAPFGEKVPRPCFFPATYDPSNVSPLP